MIGRLRGILAYKQPPWLVIDVGGVGYELEAPMSTFYDLPDVGREVILFTHHAQREDSVSLYGFLRESERRLFRDVQKVSGIGAKIALAVLSGVSVDEFARQVQTGDVAALTRIPGIGKKTAERMVVE
ncbi:MAG TPA: Holliday junction branch migration protein RuvA, partial [Pseudoxanthomonas sp.]|nr:Holliday junction branch migration protein RuvA [Pseudoxanthomonas sp.]